MSASFTADGNVQTPNLPFRPSPPLVPQATDIVAAMIQALVDRNPSSDAESLQVLRSTFPDYPLSVRLTALAQMSRGGTA